MLPGLLSLLLVDFLDLYFVSYLGVRALKLYSFLIPLIVLFSAAAIAYSVVVLAELGRLYGQAKFREARIMTQGFLYLLIPYCLVLVSIAFVLFWFISRGMSIDLLPSELDELKRYLQWRSIGFVVFTAFMAIVSVLRLNGRMFDASKYLFVFCGSYLVFSLIVLAGWIPGYAWSLHMSGVVYVAAACLAAIAALRGLIIQDGVGKRLPITLLVGFIASRKAPLVVFFRHLRQSLIVQCVTPVGIGIMTWILVSLNPEGVAIFGVLNRLEPLLLFVPMLMTLSLPAFICVNWRAGQYQRVVRVWRQSIRLILLSQVALAGLAPFCAEFIARQFCGESPIQEGIIWAIYWMPLSLAGAGISVLAVSLSKALGLQSMAIQLSFIRLGLLIFPIGFAWLSPQDIRFFFTGLFIGNCLLGLLSFYIFDRRVQTHTVETITVLVPHRTQASCHD